MMSYARFLLLCLHPNGNFYITLPCTMNEFQNVETSTLVEMLAQHTQQLTSMLLSAVNAKEFADCKKMIAQLQSEINLRQARSHNTISTRPDVPSPTDTTI